MGSAIEGISYKDIKAHVRPVKDLDVVVRCPGREVPNADLILKIAKDELKNWWVKPSDKKGPDIIPGGKLAFISEIQALGDDVKPIILVPCNKNSPINLLNAEEFFQNGNFVKPDEERMKYFESTRAEKVEVTRTINGKPLNFEVMDSIKNFTKAQWLRTCAVVTDGKTWQFKGWPFESHIDLFTTMKGFYFEPPTISHKFGQLQGEIPETMQKWKISVLKLTRGRHHDVNLRDQFFNQLEGILLSAREKKFVNHKVL